MKKFLKIILLLIGITLLGGVLSYTSLSKYFVYIFNGLVILGTFFVMRFINSINLRSDLNLWMMRGFGLFMLFLGFSFLINNLGVLGICCWVISGFIVLRSSRRT